MSAVLTVAKANKPELFDDVRLAAVSYFGAEDAPVACDVPLMGTG
ncbi:hypothetical protein ACFYO7_08995 [Nocardia salmonicida]